METNRGIVRRNRKHLQPALNAVPIKPEPVSVPEDDNLDCSEPSESAANGNSSGSSEFRQATVPSPVITNSSEKKSVYKTNSGRVVKKPRRLIEEC